MEIWILIVFLLSGAIWTWNYTMKQRYGVLIYSNISSFEPKLKSAYKVDDKWYIKWGGTSEKLDSDGTVYPFLWKPYNKDKCKVPFNGR